jgi:hypothetical protein
MYELLGITLLFGGAIFFFIKKCSNDKKVDPNADIPVPYPEGLPEY